MKVLFDHNLSPRPVNLLADLYLNSQHGFILGMDQANVAFRSMITLQHSMDNEAIALMGWSPCQFQTTANNQRKSMSTNLSWGFYPTVME